MKLPSFIHVSPVDAEFERHQSGHLSIALTPFLEEVVISRNVHGKLADLRSVRRFGIRRRRPNEEFRIVCRDGNESGQVIEIRLGANKKQLH